MPSFFRSAEDVRIFFLGETDTPEKHKTHSRLQTIFEQAVRRTGTRGHFFFHRKCASLGGRPILIFEPQGRVDRGIFQEGITRFGETLSGRFLCTAPGHIELHIKQNISEANRKKYSRAIRDTIRRLSGIMQTAGDDRVVIVTPAVQAQAARAAAEEKRQEAEEARRLQRALREERARRRDETRQRQADQATVAPRRPRTAARRASPPEAPETREALHLEATAHAVQARLTRLEAEIQAQEAAGRAVEAEALAEDARLAAEEAQAQVALAPEGQARDALSSVAAQAMQHAQQQEDAAKLAKAAVLAAREEVARQKVAEAQAALEAAEAQEAQEAQEDQEAEATAGAERTIQTVRLRTAVVRAETARQVLEIAARTLEAEVSLRALAQGLAHLETRGFGAEDLEAPDYLARLLRRNAATKGALEAILAATSGMLAAGAPRGALWTLWEAHPDLLWAQDAVESLL